MHWKVKVAAAVSGSVRPLPERVPELDQLPLGAEQLEALVEDHESVGRPLYATEVGEIERVAVGAGFASEQEAEVPAFRPAQVQVQELAPSTLLVLEPAAQE